MIVSEARLRKIVEARKVSFDELLNKKIRQSQEKRSEGDDIVLTELTGTVLAGYLDMSAEELYAELTQSDNIIRLTETG